MEILDPDLWNDDGTPKRPSKEYMERLEKAQATPLDKFTEQSYLNYARIKREAKAARGPEVGDIVHAWDVAENDVPVCRAAIVIEVDSFSDAAIIRVLIPRAAFQDWHVEHDEDKSPGESWHWPCGEGR